MTTPPDDDDQPRQWPPPYQGEYAGGQQQPPPTPQAGVDRLRERLEERLAERQADRPAVRPDDQATRPGGGPAAGQPAGDRDPLVATDLNGWFERIVGVVGRSWRPLLLLALIGAVPQAVLSHYTARAQDRIRDEGDSGISSFSDLHLGDLLTPLLVTIAVVVVVGLIVQCASVWIAVRQAAKAPLSAGACAKFVANRVLPLLAWSLVAGVLCAIGFFLLIVPGIYLALVIFPTLSGVVLIQRGGITDCFSLVRGRFWATTGRTILYALVLSLYSATASAVATAISRDHTPVFIAVDAVLTIPVGMLAVGFAIVTYAELRNRRTPTDTAALAHDLG